MLRAFTRSWIRPYRAKRPPSKMVAIVVPLSNRNWFTPEEVISLRHLRHFLGRYDKYLIAPQGMEIECEGFGIKRFSSKYFGSAAAHTHLVFTTDFYQAFADYKFILFYHLDSLVFSDQLSEWCARDLDYIGPPWLKCADSPWVTRPRVGNGGFTLLRIEAALQVLHNRYRAHPSTYWLDRFTRNAGRLGWMVRALKILQRIFPHSKLVNRPLEELRHMANPSSNNRNNDIFWSDYAVRYLPSFKVASFEDGLRFGFEVSPRQCFEMNGRQMPFGCHAWERFDRSFWEPHLLTTQSGAAPAAAGNTARLETVLQETTTHSAV